MLSAANSNNSLFRGLEDSSKSIGKTLSDAYIDFVNENDLVQAFHLKNNTVLKGRKVSIRRSSQMELMRRLFPTWVSTEELRKPARERFYLTREEAATTLLVCRNYKVGLLAD
jgi:hypothetical protein